MSDQAAVTLANLKRLLAEQAAELQEYKYRCERVQRFLSLRPTELKAASEVELAEVIERDKQLGAAERALRHKEELQARREADLEERAASLRRLDKALAQEKEELAALQRRLDAERERLEDRERGLAAQEREAKERREALDRLKLQMRAEIADLTRRYHAEGEETR